MGVLASVAMYLTMVVAYGTGGSGAVATTPVYVSDYKDMSACQAAAQQAMAFAAGKTDARFICVPKP